MSTSLLDQVRIEDALSDIGTLPTKADFNELKQMFSLAAMGDGVKLTPKQCQMLSLIFSALSVIDINSGHN